MPQASGFREDRVDQSSQVVIDGGGSLEAEVHGLWHQAEENQATRIGVEQAQTVEEVGDADLMHRETRANRGSHVVSHQAHEGAWRAVGADGVDDDDVLRALEDRQQAQPQGSTVDETHSGGGAVEALQLVNGDDAEPVVSAQDVAEPENEQR